MKSKPNQETDSFTPEYDPGKSMADLLCRYEMVLMEDGKSIHPYESTGGRYVKFADVLRLLRGVRFASDAEGE